MANQKISALTALTGANVDALADVMPIVDTSAATTKKILVSELTQAQFVLSTAQASTAGTAINFTGIQAWVKKITVQLIGVSTNGTSAIIVQLGDSGGIETTGYLGAASSMDAIVTSNSFTTGISFAQASSASNVIHGTMTLTLENASSFTWVGTAISAFSNTAAMTIGAGSKSTSAALDRIRITTVNGSDTFDAGEINILME